MGLGKTYSTKYLLDSNNNSGVAGQVLSTTSTGIDWVDANTVPGAGLWLENGNDIYNSNSANVGIGIIGPITKLHVFEAGTAMIRVDSGATAPYKAGIEFLRSAVNGGRIYNDGNAVQVKLESDFAYDAANPTRGGFMFKTAPATSGTLVDAVRIDARGNVGIGTTLPDAPLHILKAAGGANIVTALKLDPDDATTGSGVSIDFNASTTNTGASLVGSRIVGARQGGNASGFLALYTSPDASGSVPLERMRINSTGNVGIGNTININKLDVSGNINIQGGNGAYLTFNNGDANIVINNNGTGRDLSFKTYSGSSNAERMRIDKDGNVGIGTTTPNQNGFSASSKVLTVKADTSGGESVLELIGLGNVDNDQVGVLNFMSVDATTPLAAIKGLRYTSDTNGKLAFYTSNAERMRINESGNVGIGTDNPGATLQIGKGVANVLQKIHGGATAGIQIFTGGGAGTKIASLEQYFSDEGYLGLKHAGTTKIHLRANGNSYLNNGNVGIGTTSPGTALQVGGLDDGSNYDITVGWNAVSSQAVGTKRSALTFKTSQTGVNNEDIYKWDIAMVTAPATASSEPFGSDLAFLRSTRSSTSVDETTMILTQLGNVGIGTTSPEGKLHVYSGDASIAPNGDGDEFVIENSGNAGMSILTGNTSNGAIFFGDAQDNNVGIIDYDHNINTMSFTTGASKAITINASQNVGIGTTSPGAKLEVVSDVAKGVLINRTYATSSQTLSNVRAYYGLAITPMRSGGTGGLYFTNYDADTPIIQSVNTSDVAQSLLLNPLGGNVGIGVTDPEKKLEVKSDTTYDGIMLDVLSSPEITFRDRGNSDTLIGTGRYALDGFHIDTYSGNAFFIKGSNRFVGIGTTLPDSLLHIQGSTYNRVQTYFSGTYISGFKFSDLNGGIWYDAGADDLHLSAAQTNSQMLFEVAGSERMRIDSAGKVSVGSPVVGQLGVRGTTNDSTAYSFESANLSGATLFAVRNDGLSFFSGNVGIGTTSPGSKLQVAGEIRAADGNKGTPSYTFTSDTNTGMYSDTADVIDFTAGGTKSLSVTTSGATVYGSALMPSNAAILLQNQNNNNQFYIRNSGVSDATFQVGQGAPGSNVRFFINGSGNVGIGNTASTASVKLEVTGNTLLKNSNGVGDLYLGNYATANHFRFHTNNANTYFDMNCGDIYWRQGTSTRYQFFPSTANMTVQGTITQNSDARIKENVVEISDCISKVQAMRGVYYNRTDFNTEVTKVGVIAQEVEAVLPELVLESPETGLKSVAYSELTSVLINAIKEQQEIIEDLKTRITKLEN